MIIMDFKDTRPIYEQIVDKFQILILRGILEPDSKMPSVRSLAIELSVNPNTVQKAYEELERRGFIYTVKGRGSFAANDSRLLEGKKEEFRNKLRALLKEAAEVGISRREIAAYLSEEENDD